MAHNFGGSIFKQTKTYHGTVMDQSEAMIKVKEYSLLLKNYFPIEKVYLFGLYAKNTNREDSDIDLVKFSDHFADLSKMIELYKGVRK